MNDAETILILDDDEVFLKTYRDLLGRGGYRTDTARDAEAALEMLDQRRFGLILLDQKLHGPRGPDAGIDLIAEIQKRAPDAKVIIVTGYAEPRAVERAFEAGVYDYLEKNEIFDTLLLAKVRNAFDLVRSQHLSGLDVDDREAELRARWEQAQAETDANRKGKLLEDLMVLLFHSVPGWRAQAHVANDIEEIDIVIRNESEDPLWSQQGAYLIAECKHWSKPVGVDQLRSFLWKLHNRYGQCCVGFFISTNRFTGPFHDTLRSERSGNVLVVPIDGDTLTRLIESPERSEMLKDLHQQAAFG